MIKMLIKLAKSKSEERLHDQFELSMTKIY